MTRWPDGSTTKQPKVSSWGAFGPRKAVKLPNGQYSSSDHKGTDFVGFSKVKAIRGGKVTLAGPFSGFGNCVIVRFTAKSGSLVDILYAHLKDGSIKVRKGQTIDEGDDIGTMGATGNADGNNLHVEVRYYTNGKLSYRDPVKWIGKLIADAKPAAVKPKPPAKPAAAKPKAHPPTVKRGSRGETVKKLQRILVKRNHPMPVDGIFGARTEEVVRAVQKKHRLVVDGIVGPKTWSVLGQ